MFVRHLSFLEKPALISVSLLFTVATLCAEPVSNEVQKAEIANEPRALEKSNSSKIFRPYLPSNPFSDSTRFTPRPRTPSVPQNAPPSTRRQDERLDRERNWIFVSPDDRDKTATVEEAIGVGGMFESERSKRSQSVVNQFLTNGRENMTDSNNQNQNVFGNQSTFDSNKLFENLNKPLQGPDLFEQGRGEKISGFNAEQKKLAEMWRDQYGPNALRMREEKQTRMQEYENMFRSASSIAAAPAAGNGLNPLGSQNSLQPVAPARGVPDRYESGASVSSLDRLKGVPRPAPGTAAFERPTANTRVFGASATPPPVVETTKPERPPGVLVIPKRRL